MEAEDTVRADEAVAAGAGEAQAHGQVDGASQALTEEEMVEAAIRAGEQAAEDDFKLELERTRADLLAVREELNAAIDARTEADVRAQDAEERCGRLQADWENYRRRTARERLQEQERATEKLIVALLPVVDDIERALDHARAQEMDESFSQFVDGVDAVRTKLLGVFEHEGVEPVDPVGEAFDPVIHQAVGRVEDYDQFDETVNDVYQKGYRMAGKVLRSAMVTVTHGGPARPAPEETDSDEKE
ncbi:nucleotide exchange factor GrpE [Collinsella sp. AGMB00827]|uniref:Protein GrpE n=2 Tax=Collinsella ureilytica TaxID=2869515 RepID=A0ABS7MJZ5_9ACTN|nr:nucleotide exchange factor GrpE [Collinsella urealyticum]MBY4797701.1 nucleotide exchange factor GrpE [Collinsella urealyticum]